MKKIKANTSPFFLGAFYSNMRIKSFVLILTGIVMYSVTSQAKVTNGIPNSSFSDKTLLESHDFPSQDTQAETLGNRIFWNCNSLSSYCYHSCPEMFQQCRSQVVGICRGRDALYTDGSSTCLITY